MVRHIGVSTIVCSVLTIGLLLAACGGPITHQDAEATLYDNFRTVVATAPGDGYTPYWLGRQFEAGGQQFRGPFTSVIGHEVPGYGVSTDYDSITGTFVTITSYSPTAWNENKARTPIGSSSRAVTVAAHDALLTTTVEQQSVAAQRLDVQMGQTHVVAVTYALQPLTPAGNANPLVDEQTFLSVMQQLRPYPQ